MGRQTDDRGRAGLPRATSCPEGCRPGWRDTGSPACSHRSTLHTGRPTLPGLTLLPDAAPALPPSLTLSSALALPSLTAAGLTLAPQVPSLAHMLRGSVHFQSEISENLSGGAAVLLPAVDPPLSQLRRQGSWPQAPYSAVYVTSQWVWQGLTQPRSTFSPRQEGQGQPLLSGQPCPAALWPLDPCWREDPPGTGTALARAPSLLLLSWVPWEAPAGKEC